MSRLLRRIGAARMTGLAIAGTCLASIASLTSSTTVVLAGAVADGIGLVWLVAVAGTAIQRYTPARLQGRATAAWTMLVITPQTISIAAGAVLISFINYRILLLTVVAVTGVCAFVLLAHPAAEPAAGSPSPTPALQDLPAA
jgi:MFS family permease